MISYYLPSGSKIGVGYQVHALANQLVRRGHRVTVFSGCGPSEGSLYDTVQVPLHGANRTFKFAWFMRRVDWTQFDVLHAHGDDYWLSGRPRPLHVRTMHGSCLSEMLHIRGLKQKLRMGLLGIGELAAIAVCDVCVGVSHNTYGWLHLIHRHIPNGVDLSRFGHGPKSDVPSILFVGTYGMRKRGWLLADAFQSTILPAVPTAQLWMVCQDAPDAPGVRVLGRVSDRELARLYSEAWVFCLPSTYEGFGIPYVEAMAAGTPVVATANAGAREVTEDGRLGMLTSEAELGRSLLRLISSETERSEFAMKGRIAAEKYDLDQVARAYEELYLTPVAVPGSRRRVHAV
jgi:phosphatidylinositol alpha-mannosyltransferase